jgi:hypothetical protein
LAELPRPMCAHSCCTAACSAQAAAGGKLFLY